MKKKNQWIAALLAALLCLPLAACDGTGKEPTESGKKGDNSSGSPVSDKEAEYFDNVPVELDGTTVKFATWIDHKSNESAMVLSDFTDLTGINVELTRIAQTEYVSKMSSLVASGDSPDVVVCNGEWPRLLPVMQPLDDTILDASDPFWDQGVVKTYTVGGRPYLVNVEQGPWDMGSGCVYYNKRIFEDNGITTPDLYVHEKRWTLDNFYKAARELKNAIGCGVGIDTETYLYAYADGFVEWDAEAGEFKSGINDPAFLSAWQRMAEARDAGYAEVTSGGSRWMFEQQKMGMLLSGGYGLRKTGWFQEHDIKWEDLGYVPLPTDADGKQVYGAQSDRGYGICKGAKNPDGAAYFLRYFLNGDHYDEDELYKNAECAKLYHELQKNKDTSKFGCSYAVFSIFSNDSDPMYGVFPDLKDCTAAQIPTVLATKANTFNSCIERANTILKDAIAQNQK